MSGCELIVIGASWGGLHAVGQVLGALPAGFGVPIVVIQHRAENGDGLLADLLDRRGTVRVREADDKDSLEPGCALVAPSGYHLLVARGHVELSTEDRVQFSRPSIDLALESAAEAYGAGLVGVILTGNNDDGATGLAAVRRGGGVAIVQEPRSAERPKMPAAALAATLPHAVVELDGIAPLLVQLAANCGALDEAGAR